MGTDNSSTGGTVRRMIRLAKILIGLGLLGHWVACGQEASEPPVRINLFDQMGEAEITGPPEGGEEPAEAVTAIIDFDENRPEEIWFGRARDHDLEYEQGEVAEARIAPEAGLEGAGLKLGPDVPEDRSRALIFLPASGLARIRITARVRLLNNPMAAEASSREVLRVIEHFSEKRGPSRWFHRGGDASEIHRISRIIDPSGWDRLEYSFISTASTRTLEIQLLHRSGQSREAVTVFDDLRLDQAPLPPIEQAGQLHRRYRPRDGREEATPWRIRVELRAHDGHQMEMRDAVMLPPPARLAIPVQVPPAGKKPILRFHCGMTREAYGTPGDGARIEVAFEDQDSGTIPIGGMELDPKNDGTQRAWLPARFDLAGAAGRRGRLVFSTMDIPGSEPDAMDTVLIATPRIEPAEEVPKGFNVLLIGVDTLRPDRMSAFGYGRATTPNLARLADAGIRFPRTRSQAPWTLPSFSSILTSLYPSSHGAGKGGHDEWTPIDPTTTSLAEVLSRVGYETQGIVASGLVSHRYGLDQGFEAFRSTWNMESAKADTPSVVRFIETHRTTPWFLFWHIMDPHLPYTTEPRFREPFTDADYRGRFGRGDRVHVPFQALDPRPGRRWYTHEGPPPMPKLTEEDRRLVSDCYDAEVAEMDAWVGQVLDAVRRSGQWERTIIAFISDHGEGLGDHNHYHHGYTLFEDQVRIPMLLRIPGRDEGRVIGRPVAAIDLAPTILEAVGLEPPPCFQGVDRLAKDAPETDAYFIEYPTYDSSAEKAWVMGDFKYLHDPVFRRSALYRLDRDPGESRDVASDYPKVVSRARAALDRFRWDQLQKGRFHLRIHGAPGKRLQLDIETDDLFDANFACRPEFPEDRFTLDLERRHLRLDTVMDDALLEMVFWCRGSRLRFDLGVDGEPLPGGLALGGRLKFSKIPVWLERGQIPMMSGEELPRPEPGQAMLWLETGAAQVQPVVPTPEEIEVLERLGYAR